MKKPIYITTAIIFLLLNLCLTQVYSQARTSTSLGYDVNLPLHSGYKFGYGFNWQTNIKVSNKVAISPVLGYDRINSDGGIIYSNDGYGHYRYRDNIDLFYLGLGAKYYFDKQFFARAGAMIYIGGGNEDLVTGGIGGTAAVGYDWTIDKRSTFELTLRTDIINFKTNHREVGAIAGLGIAYKFNFRKLKE
ncbi:hypothetical protein HH214_11780 [Mucilaginibacter robiniae]|uniref:Outer membrane protein beta-barrel domain-containing protein n=1 Tax=Mucilaginibacter robiniae TaxID=2728022 RepID=A0A7L5DZU2_9SPHI|nr:hypothetical protein [Mucilaginibacter robiniae]QJD96505.1 hypothetical protein HH214_11780 [Mucilaginibacter robiniae]